MANDQGDQRGVLGNLPKQRPGQRSAKRSTAARGRAPATSTGSGSRKAEAGSRSRPKPKPKPKAAPTPAPKNTSAGLPDPIGTGIKLMVRVADAGFKTVDGIIKRLPGR